MTWVDIVIPIISSIIGGLLTLGGVAWTIKSNNKDRKLDLERIEIERREDERKRIIPYMCLNHLEEVSGSVNSNFGFGLDFNRKEDLAKLTNKHFYCCSIKNFSIKNVSKNCIIVESIIVNDKEHIFSGEKLVESGKSILIKTTENWIVNSATMLNSIQLKCNDLIGNSYLLDCKFKYTHPNGFHYIETEIDSVVYKGLNLEYSIVCIDLPKLLQTKQN